MKLFDRQGRRIEQAAHLRRGGDAPAAIDILAVVLTAEPAHVAANAEMARALLLLGDPVGAEEHLRTAIEQVLDYTLIVELAQALAEQDRVDEADQYLDAAMFMTENQPRLDPGEALIVRAVIRHAQERDDEALAALDAIERKRARHETWRLAERVREAVEASLTRRPPTAEG